MSIGTVLNQLRDEFPEVTISKIRFLEAEGLVEPQRTPSGYRKFSPQDVERLGQVLRMQRDHYLPLKVIREHLDALERGEPVPLPAAGPRSGSWSTARWEPAERAPTAARMGRAELLAAAEVERGGARRVGVVRAASPRRRTAATTPRRSPWPRLVADLGRFGLEPRHLRAMKAAADREAGLVEQVVAPLRRHRNPQTRAHAEATREGAGGALRTAARGAGADRSRGPAALIWGSPTTQTGRARPRVAV